MMLGRWLVGAALAAALLAVAPAEATRLADDPAQTPPSQHASTEEIGAAPPLSRMVGPVPEKRWQWNQTVELASPGRHAPFAQRVKAPILTIRRLSPAITDTVFLANIENGTHDLPTVTSVWLVRLYDVSGFPLDAFAFNGLSDRCGKVGSISRMVPVPDDFYDRIDHVTIQGFYKARSESAC